MVSTESTKQICQNCTLVGSLIGRAIMIPIGNLYQGLHGMEPTGFLMLPQQ